MLKKLDLSENEEVTVKYEWVGVSEQQFWHLAPSADVLLFQVYYILEDGPPPALFCTSLSYC